MDDKTKIDERKIKTLRYQRTKNIPRNWLCRLFGHSPNCNRCDPDRETQPILSKVWLIDFVFSSVKRKNREIISVWERLCVSVGERLCVCGCVVLKWVWEWFCVREQLCVSLTTSDFVLPLNFISLLYSVWDSFRAFCFPPAWKQPGQSTNRGRAESRDVDADCTVDA